MIVVRRVVLTSIAVVLSRVRTIIVDRERAAWVATLPEVVRA